MKIKLNQIVSSPFRDFTINPLDEEKIIALIESIQTTGFWKNIVVREIKNGKFEIVFGHHRAEALRRLKIEIADFEVIKATDAEVLQKWSRDHSDVFNHDIFGVFELVIATVNALGNGSITLPIGDQAKLEYRRTAPGFKKGGCVRESGTDYTNKSLAVFLGMTRKHRDGVAADENVEVVLDVEELIERRIWKRSDIRNHVGKNGKVTKEALRQGIQASILAETRRKEVITRQTEEFQRQQAEQKKKFEEADKAQAEAERVALEARRKEAELKKQVYAEERTKKEQQRVRDAEAKRKQAEEALRKAEERKEREQKRITRSKKSKEDEQRQKQKDVEEQNRRRELSRAEWVKTVIGRVQKMYDSHDLVRNNVRGFIGKAAPITIDEKNKLVGALKELCARVTEDIENLR